MASILGRSI